MYFKITISPVTFTYIGTVKAEHKEQAGKARCNSLAFLFLYLKHTHNTRSNMVNDLQLFRQITRAKDNDLMPEEEKETDIALLLSAIELMEPSVYANWKNESPKTSVFFKSGSSATVLADFKDLFKLWQNYLNQAAVLCHVSAN